jgi:hypothetical protein
VSTVPLRALHPRLTTARDLLRAGRERSGDRLPAAGSPLAGPLGGGLPRGRLIELVGAHSSGRFGLLLELLATTTRAGENAALVDLGDHLDPRSAEAAGVELARLLWLRPHRLEQALLAAEMLLHTGFPLVTVDLGLPPVPGGRGPEAGWVRLARAADERRSVLLVSTPYRATGTAAGAVLESRRGRRAWRGTGRAPRRLAGIAPEVIPYSPP